MLDMTPVSNSIHSRRCNRCSVDFRCNMFMSVCNSETFYFFAQSWQRSWLHAHSRLGTAASRCVRNCKNDIYSGGSRILVGGVRFGGEYGEREAQVYNGSLGDLPIAGSRAQGQRARGESPAAERFLDFAQPKRRQICPILADFW